MSVFRVGQRVKYVGYILNQRLPAGAEGVVLRNMGVGHPGGVVYEVDFPKYVYGRNSNWIVFASSIVPLTDPAADAFMERIRKLGREPVNSPEKVTV